MVQELSKDPLNILIGIFNEDNPLLNDSDCSVILVNN